MPSENRFPAQSRARHLALVTLLVLVAGISVPAAQQGAPAHVPGVSAAPTGADTLERPSANYVIGPGDRLRITVWNQQNVSGDYVVEGDGAFTFPLIGRVAANGLTQATLEGELRRLLADGYFKNPQVTAAVIEYRSKRVFIIGALRQPGTYPITRDVTLIEALASAGSTAADAADHAFVIRSPGAKGPVLPGEDASAQVSRVDLRQLDAGQTTEVLVRDGDTVYVPRAAIVFVYGQVRRPGSYPVRQATTVRQAVSLAGGLTDFGAANRITILRVVDGKEREIRVRLQDAVEPGDTIVVPERYF